MENTMTKKKCGLLRRIAFALSSLMTAATVTAVSAAAWDEQVTIGSAPEADDMIGRIIGILLTITRYVGVALVVYGVYEVVMSFMQNQPEAKTKGIIMALAGAVMIGLKSILTSMQIIS